MLTPKLNPDVEKRFDELTSRACLAGPALEEFKSFIAECLAEQKHEMVRAITQLEIDGEKHAKGSCSFNLTALCSAEEQRIKRLLRSAIKEE